MSMEIEEIFIDILQCIAIILLCIEDLRKK